MGQLFDNPMMKRSNNLNLIKAYCNGLCSPTTRYAVEIELKNANKQMALHKWDKAYGLKFLRSLEGKLKPSTIIVKGRRLQGYFKHEIGLGLRSENPIDTKHFPQNIDARIPQALTAIEAQHLIKQIPKATWLGMRDRLAVGLMLTMGYRISTVVDIKWEDFEQRGTDLILHIRSKGGKLSSRKIRPDIGNLLKAFEKATKEIT